MIDMIKAAPDIALDDPLVGCPLAPAVFGLCHRSHGQANMLQSAMAASSGSEPVRDMPELRFEDRLQKVLNRALHDAVRDGGDTQGSELPRLAGLGDQLPSARARPIPARPQTVANLNEKGFAPLPLLNPFHRHPVDPGGATAFVAGYLAPGASQVAEIGYPIPQLAIARVGIIPAPLI
jgi:hypothetical protein